MKLFSSFSHPVGPRPWTRDWIVMQWDALILWKKLTAIITLIVLTASIIPVRAYFEHKARYMELATRLSEKGIVDTSYTGTRMNEYVPQEETVRIAINLGGGLDFDCQGSRFLSTDTTNVFDCGYQDFAQKKGILSAGYNPEAYTSRASAVKSLVIAAGLTPLDSSVPYTDIMSDVGYVARAYEMGCTDTARYFYPDSLISRTEMLELSDCIDSAAESYIASSTVGGATTDTIVPNTPNPSTPENPQIIYITGATTEKVVEKVITEQTTIYVTGSTEPSLPSSPNTLLGYDDAGNIINIGLGSGVELKDGSIQVAPQIIIEKEISVPEFSSAPSTPTTVYPTTSIGQFQLMTGFFPTGGSSSSSSSNITSIFGRQGTVIGQIGDYTTDLVTEGANLYFTDTRAQNALSGSLASLASDISTLSGILAVSSFSGVSSLQSTIDSVSGSLTLLSTNFSTLSGDFQTLSGTVITIGNTLTSLSGSLAGAHADIVTLSGLTVSLGANIAFLSGTVVLLGNNLTTLTNSLTTLSGTVVGNTTNIATLSGSLANKIGLSSLSVTGPLTYNNLTGVFGFTAGSDGQVLVMSGTTAIWKNPGSATAPVTSVYGRIGDVTAQAGDYTTDLVTEGTRLYFTDTRAQNALSGTVLSLSGRINTLSADLATLSGVVAASSFSGMSTLLSEFSTLSGSFNTLSGRVNTLSNDYATLYFSVSGLASSQITLLSQFSTLSGSVNTSINTFSGGLALANSAISTLSDALSGLSSTVTNNFNSLTTDISTLSGVVVGIGGTLTTLGNDLTALSTALDTTNSALATATGEISALSGALGATNTNLSNLTTVVSDNYTTLSGALGSLSGALALTDANLANTIADLSTLSGTLSTTNTSLTSLASVVTLLSGSLDTTNIDLSNLTLFANALSGSLDTLSLDLADTISRVTTLSGGLATLSGILAITNSDLSSLSGTVATLSTNFTTLSGSLSNLTTNFNSLSGVVSTANTNISTLFSNLTTTNSNLATATGNISTISGSLASVIANLATTNSNLATATGNILTLQTGLSTTNSNLATATGNIATLFSSLATTNSNLATATGNISMISGSLASVIANLASTTGSLNAVIANLATTNSNLATATGNILTLQTGLSTTNSNLATATGNIATLFTNLATTNSNLATATGTISALGGSLITVSNNLNSLSGTVNTLSTNFNSLSGVVATKIGLTSLSATGGITYNNTTGQFGDLFTFNNGLTRVGNTVGIGTLTGGMLTGFTSGQLVFGSPTSGLTQSSNLFWNSASGSLGIGTSVTPQTLTVSGSLSSTKYLLGLDLSLLPIANGQSALTSWWGLQLVGNRQANVDYTPTNYGNQDDYGVLIPNQQATKIALMIRGATGQSGNLTQWETSTGMALAAVTANGNFVIGTGSTSSRFHIFDNGTITGTIMKIEAPSVQSGNLLQITGSGGRNLLRIAQNGTDPLDIERVTIGQGGISASKPDSLARDQLYVFGRINSSWDHFSADFLNSTTTLANDAITPEGLQFDRINITAGYAVSNVTGISGTRQIIVNTNANASALLGAYNVTEANLNPVYEARAIINTSNATTRAIVGFTDRAINATTLNTDTNNATTEVFFRKLAASTTWQAVTRSAANATEVTTNTAIPVNQWNIFRIEIENGGVVRQARFYINGTLVATHNGTTIPATGARFGHQIGLGITNTTANTMDIDYVRVWSDDPAGASPVSNKNNTSTVSGEPSVDFSGSSILPSFIYTSKQYLGDISFILEKMGNVNSGSIANTTTLGADGTVTIEEYGNYILNNLKQSLEKMSGVKIDTILSIRTLDADLVNTKKLLTDELCIQGTCFTSTDLLRAIANSGSSQGETIQNIYNTYTTVIQSSGATMSAEKELSVADRAILDSLSFVDSTLIPQVEVYFKKIVTFANDVVFQSRVIFSDPDMAGQVSIKAGKNSVHVKFDRPYPGVPVITLTPVGHFQMGVVSEATKNGFTIEIESVASRKLLFNWVALMVSGAASRYDGGVDTSIPTVSVPVNDTPSEPVVLPVVSGETPTISVDPIIEVPVETVPDEVVIETPIETVPEEPIDPIPTDPVIETPVDTPPVETVPEEVVVETPVS